MQKRTDELKTALNNEIDSRSICAANIAQINFDKSDANRLNWNTMLDNASGHFQSDFIHYGLHYLYAHIPLAWEDILKTHFVWAEVKLDYQQEIICSKTTATITV